jgi:uncharacterized protein (UPF0371 family)
MENKEIKEQNLNIRELQDLNDCITDYAWIGGGQDPDPIPFSMAVNSIGAAIANNGSQPDGAESHEVIARYLRLLVKICNDSDKLWKQISLDELCVRVSDGRMD